jgi:hypothetical protein
VVPKPQPAASFPLDPTTGREFRKRLYKRLRKRLFVAIIFFVGTAEASEAASSPRRGPDQACPRGFRGRRSGHGLPGTLPVLRFVLPGAATA